MATSNLTLASEVKYLKGVGPARAELLAARNIRTVEDLLYYTPFRYEDRTHITRIGDLVPGQTTTILAQVLTGGLTRTRKGVYIYDLAARDASGMIRCIWFNAVYLEKGKVFRQGQRVFFYGKVDRDFYGTGNLQIVQPQFEILPENESESGNSIEVERVVPIYESMAKLGTRVIRRLIWTALASLGDNLPDRLPWSVRQKNRLVDRATALRQTHFPDSGQPLEQLCNFRTPPQVRLIFEEFFYYQIALALRRSQDHRQRGIAMRVREEKVREALKRILPFKPTAAQKRVLAEIAGDLEKPFPMHRLLEGDVGSGKTIVALEAATIVIENGYQVALMAPTEILAAQHFLSARRVFAPAGYGVDLVVSGRKRAEREEALARIESGETKLVVGTHALIEDPVKFHKLGLAIVDEQHRFGVLQRKRLIEKGASPHVLVMTATPIPRTLALTLYGDLDLSVIDEMPPGRTPIDTRWTADAQLPGVWEFLRREIAKGRQAYVLYPVIEESKQELKAATAEYERLAKNVFPKLRVGLLHGRLKNDDKDSVMEQFRRGELQILVATTVIEVGVDVPNATVMVIEHADRFGLAQLHQLRGRIGRGKEKSYCILVAPKTILGDARERIETMVATSNGFEIAERDLKQRGPGEFFGTRQSGDAAFSFAQPLRDHEILEMARREAFAIAENPAQAEEIVKRLEAVSPTWRARYQLASVG